MHGAAVSCRRISKRYGQVVALVAFTLDIEPGEFVTLLGPNGSGKSAALNILMAMGFFITPALLGGRTDMLLANLIEQQVGPLKWGFAAALALAFGLGVQDVERLLSLKSA